MSIDFLTPVGALLALAVVLPLAVFGLVSRRADRIRTVLGGLPELTARERLVPLGALVALAALLGLAAAQPLLERSTTRRVRADAEVLMVLDISRSMLAQSTLESPTRIERAKAAAARMRAALPGVPVGLASMTNRVLPHLYPSADEEVFRATLERVIGIENPPPGTSVFTVLQNRLRIASNLTSLGTVSGRRYFSPTSRRRLLVVLADGETPPVPPSVAQSLRKAKIETILLHVWAPNEKVFTNGEPEVRYHVDPRSRSILEQLAAMTRGTVYDESQLGAAIEDARNVLGSGPTVDIGSQPDRMPLAPYLAVAAFLPLGLLLWRRDR